MDTPAPPVTAALVRRLARALNRALPHAVAGDVRATHQARVASRRLREAVPVLARGLRGSRAGKSRRMARRLTRALGRVRELDVTIGLTDELARDGQMPRAAIESVRARVVEKRERSRETMLDELARLDASRLNTRLVDFAAAVAAADNDEWRQALATRVARRNRAFSKAVEAAGHIYVPERLHAVRIAGKKLRYALELAAETGTTSAARHVRALKRVQDVLGRLHDLQMLGHHVTTLHTAPAGTTEITHDLDRVATHVEGECRRQHAKYVAAIGTARELCAGIGADVVPALARSARPRRGLKMTLPKPAGRASGTRR